MSNLYYELSNGELVPKHKVDAAFELIERLREGCSIIGLSDIDVFTKGDKLDAISTTSRLMKRKKQLNF